MVTLLFFSYKRGDLSSSSYLELNLRKHVIHICIKNKILMQMNSEHMILKSSVRKTDLFGSLVNKLIFTLTCANLPGVWWA